MMVTVDTVATPVAVANAGTDSIDLLNDSTISFDNSGSSGSSFEWFFGDGDSATGGDVTHTFDSSGTYNVMLVAIIGNCEDTSTVAVQVTNSTSLRALTESDAVRVHPNPSSGRIQVELNKVFDGKVRVMDLTGRTVHRASFKGSDQWLDLSKQEEGVYFVRLLKHDGSTFGIRRIIMTR